MRYVLAIDEGTTGTTCLVVSNDGRIVGRGYREITQHFPKPGWVEHDANEIFDRTIDAARDAIEQSGVTPEAIGITNQRETVVVWDRQTSEPVGRAIVWQDRRTAERCRELADSSARITELTGLPLDPYFSATKLEYILRDPELRKRADAGELAAGTIDTWLIWRLTGGEVHATDPTNASRTMLFDIDAREWSDELCAIFGIPKAMLPEVRQSSGDFGVAHHDGLPGGMPILGVAGDQQAALYGQGCWSAGEAKNTYGTGAFLLLNTGAKRPHAGEGLLTTVACDASGGYAYALEGSIFIAGAAVQWLRDGLRIIDNAAETEALARSLDSNDGVYFVPALVGLGAPHWEPEARGTITGLTRGTTRAHLARAALEAMVYGTADVFDAMGTASGVPFARLRVDGGAAVNDWMMQFQSDIIRRDVERPEMVESTAFGAAGLAGIAAGVWKDANEFLSVKSYKKFSPTMSRADAADLRAGWQRAIDTTLFWAQR
ncbi:MAG TPA: glycerol kinase GlpK [Gemmatimonadaceae bacterium]|nr:glycerol kinase GlpK [Gemmatimonadaceae bacterium]